MAASDGDEFELELVAPTLIFQMTSMTRVDGLQICHTLHSRNGYLPRALDFSCLVLSQSPYRRSHQNWKDAGPFYSVKVFTDLVNQTQVALRALGTTRQMTLIKSRTRKFRLWA